MIIEPTPTNPRSRRGRAFRVLGIVVPPVLLVAVIGVGTFGQKPAPPSPAPRPTQVAVASAEAPAPSATPPERQIVIGDPTAVPTVVADLGVRTITDALAQLAAGGAPKTVAVSGYLGLVDATGGCVDPTVGPLGPLCDRVGVLTEQPWVSDGAGAVQAFSTHIHPRFPVGVRLPDDAVRATPTARSQIHVVVVGRFESGGDACRPVGPVCGPAFEVDAVAWSEGALLRTTPVLDAGIDPEPPDWIFSQQRVAEAAALGGSGTILFEALLRPATIARVDPVAAAALAAQTPRSGLVWYVRSLTTGANPVPFPLDELPAPFMSWVLLDNASGTVLARSAAPAG